MLFEKFFLCTEYQNLQTRNRGVVCYEAEYIYFNMSEFCILMRLEIIYDRIQLLLICFIFIDPIPPSLTKNKLFNVKIQDGGDWKD